MVYSGYDLVFGIRFRSTEDLIDFMKKFCYGTSLTTLIEKIKDLDDDRWEQENLVNTFLSEEGYDIRVHRKRCCYDDGSWYFGYWLGTTEFVYRCMVDVFSSFDDYDRRMRDELDRVEMEWAKKQIQIRKELRNIAKLYNASIGEGDKFDDDPDLSPSFYKYANDCEYCS